MIKITITCENIDDIIEEPQFGVRPWFKADFFSVINTAVDHFKNKHEGHAMELEGWGIKVKIEEQASGEKAITRQPYTIDIIKVHISHIEISEEEREAIHKKLLEESENLYGETKIEAFKIYSKRLEKAFDAEHSLFGMPNLPTRWRIILPKEGNFDANPAQISVLFDIKERD